MEEIIRNNMIKVKLYIMWLANRVVEAEIPGALPVNVVRIIDIKRFVFCFNNERI